MSTSNLFVNAIRTTRKIFPDFLSKKLINQVVTQKKPTHRNTNTVGRLLDSIQDIPSHTILLGQCIDGLPFLMSLGEPALGAILIGCDVGNGKTHQLQLMVDSAIRNNSARELQIAVLTLNPAEWENIQSDPKSQRYLHDIFAWYDDRAEQTINIFTELAEDRRQGKRLGADVLFILDDIDTVEDLSYEAQVNLHWLLEYGSQSGVWVVGTIDAGLSSGFRYWIDTFRTRIVGRVGSSDDSETLAMRPDSQAAGLTPGMFRVWIGVHWLTYRLVPLGD